MPYNQLLDFLPPGAAPFLERWCEHHFIHIRITRSRASKLGDYRKMPDGSHEITVNGNLQPQLFFFVLTHELAHLRAFHLFKRIAPHGAEWKMTFREMLQQSLAVYTAELQLVIARFSVSPKANFMSSTELVKYFNSDLDDGQDFIENLEPGSHFIYRSESYVMERRLKKNYLCIHLKTGRKYTFKPLAKVTKVNRP